MGGVFWHMNDAATREDLYARYIRNFHRPSVDLTWIKIVRPLPREHGHGGREDSNLLIPGITLCPVPRSFGVIISIQLDESDARIDAEEKRHG